MTLGIGVRELEWRVQHPFLYEFMEQERTTPVGDFRWLMLLLYYIEPLKTMTIIQKVLFCMIFLAAILIIFLRINWLNLVQFKQ